MARMCPKLYKYYPNNLEHKARIDAALDFCGTTFRPLSLSSYDKIIYSRINEVPLHDSVIQDAVEAEQKM